MSRAIDWNGMIHELEEQRAAAIATIDEQIAAVRVLAGAETGNGKRATKAKGTRKPGKPKAKTSPAVSVARAEGDEKAAKALELWKRGKFVTEIAAELSVSGATIYNWKKRDAWPAR